MVDKLAEQERGGRRRVRRRALSLDLETLLEPVLDDYERLLDDVDDVESVADQVVAGRRRLTEFRRKLLAEQTARAKGEG